MVQNKKPTLEQVDRQMKGSIRQIKEQALSNSRDGRVSLPANLFAGILAVLIFRSRDGDYTEQLLKDIEPYVTDEVREILKETREMMDELTG